VTAENELEAEEKAIAKFYNKDLDHVDADHYHYYEMHLLNDHYVTEVEA
jgi:regulator of sigma D